MAENRLIEAANLQVREAALTGAAVNQRKTVQLPKEVSLGACTKFFYTM